MSDAASFPVLTESIQGRSPVHDHVCAMVVVSGELVIACPETAKSAIACIFLWAALTGPAGCFPWCHSGMELSIAGCNAVVFSFHAVVR